jgi:DNA gyrase subunit B
MGAKQQFTNHDFRDGMIGIVNAKLHKAQFSSQDKAKLTDERMGKDFEELVLADAEKFFKSNKAMAKRLCDRAAKINELKNKFKSSKAVATALGKVKRQGLPPNFAPAHKSVKPADRELIIVEGASAAGPLRQVRQKHQALLPLKGKIMNVQRAKGDKALLSRDILNILGAMGFDPKAEDPLAKLQIGKIICLADPDPDGHHINCLLLTLFKTYLPGMFERGMIYVADTPEFYAISKDQIFVGDKLSEVRAKLEKAKIKADVFHVKGWGEVDAQVVKKWVIDTDSRKLIKLNALSAEDKTVFGRLMGAKDDVVVEKATDD